MGQGNDPTQLFQQSNKALEYVVHEASFFIYTYDTNTYTHTRFFEQALYSSNGK